MPFSRSVMPRVLSAVFLGMGICIFALLAVWYFEIVLWIILGPLGLASTYLALRLWRPSPAAMRAVHYWSASVIWLVILLLAMFKDVTVIGGLSVVAASTMVVWMVYAAVRWCVGSRLST